jgi:quinol monooxygenase YgiN
MENRKVSVIARIRAREGREDAVRAALMALIAPTTAEKGCISYDLHQSTEDPALFMFYENWLSREDLEDHLQTPHLSAWRAIATELLADPIEITLWKLLS